MKNKLFLYGQKEFNAARQLKILPENHPSNNLNGHTFKGGVRLELIEGSNLSLADIKEDLSNVISPMDLSFLNELEEEPEDITPEIKSEGTEHQTFFTGTAITEDLLLHSYSDTDENNLPIGISNSMESTDAGTGDLTVTLRHMPLEDGNTIKEEGLEDMVLEEGFGNVGGANDVSVTFSVTVE